MKCEKCGSENDADFYRKESSGRRCFDGGILSGGQRQRDMLLRVLL